MKDNRGLTLMEVLIVIAIASVLTVAMGYEYFGWQGSYKVESQTKDIYADLMDARARAMQRNRRHFISLLTPTTYTIHEDDSNGVIKVPDGDGTLQLQAGNPADSEDTRLGTFPKTTEFGIYWNNTAITAREDLVFNTQGLATILGTISLYIDKDGDGEQDYLPDYDCIIISPTRIIVGQLDVNDTPVRSDDVCTPK